MTLAVPVTVDLFDDRIGFGLVFLNFDLFSSKGIARSTKGVLCCVDRLLGLMLAWGIESGVPVRRRVVCRYIRLSQSQDPLFRGMQLENIPNTRIKTT